MPTSYKISITNMKTGEVKIFRSTVKASEYLKRSKMYVRVRLGRANKTAFDIDGNEYKIAVISIEKIASKPKNPKNPDNAKFAGYKEPTLCYSCARAYSLCPWSKRFEPIEGWDAVPTKLKVGQSRNGSGEIVPQKEIDSYLVINCPMFIEDGKTIEERRKQRQMLKEERLHANNNSSV